jgi:NAD(P)-dependent dehydrogenase (short-subunit alcohol dehydrogenase family)
MSLAIGFEGKVAIVTGAAHGIGAAYVNGAYLEVDGGILLS